MWTKHTTKKIPADLYYGADVVIQTEDGNYEGPYNVEAIDWSPNRGAGTIARYRELEVDSDWTLYTASMENSCPVNPDVMVEIETAGADVLGPRSAKRFRWTYTGRETDIVAYKVVASEAPTPAPTRPVTKLGGISQTRLLLL